MNAIDPHATTAGYTLRVLLCAAVFSPLLPFLHAQPTTLTSANASDCCDLSGNGFDPLGPDGEWWTQPEYVHAAKLRPEQQQRLNEIYKHSTGTIQTLQQQYQQASATLDNMLRARQPVEEDVFAQIARVEEARSAAAKAIATVKLNLRPVLTSDQWKQVQKLQQKQSK